MSKRGGAGSRSIYPFTHFLINLPVPINLLVPIYFPAFTHFLIYFRRQLVARKLLQNEAVVRLVAVERADHVVAIAPHLGADLIVLVAVGIGVARQVQPVPRPAL